MFVEGFYRRLNNSVINVADKKCESRSKKKTLKLKILYMSLYLQTWNWYQTLANFTEISKMSNTRKSDLKHGF